MFANDHLALSQQALLPSLSPDATLPSPSAVEEKVKITQVLPGGAAEKAKLQVGDEIRAIDGVSIEDKPHNAIVDILKRVTTGVTLTIVRSGGAKKPAAGALRASAGFADVVQAARAAEANKSSASNGTASNGAASSGGDAASASKAKAPSGPVDLTPIDFEPKQG